MDFPYKKVTGLEKGVERFVVLVKVEGQHTIAEDGGRVAAAQKGGKGKVYKNWNSWSKPEGSKPEGATDTGF